MNRSPRLPLLRFALLRHWRRLALFTFLLGMVACDPGTQTQVVITYRADPATVERAALVRLSFLRQGLDAIVQEEALMGPDTEGRFPLTVPVHPIGEDASRRFHVVAELVDTAGTVFQRRVTIGGFEAGKRNEVVVRFDTDCDGILGCDAEQTCGGGECRPACVVPVSSEGRPETPQITCAAFRKVVRITSATPAADVLDFPVLVRVTDSDLGREARPDGTDIAFVDETGALLDHELVHFEPVTGELIAWVNVPVIRAGEVLELVMHFGGVSAEIDGSGVWERFTGVWHLDESSGPALDQSPLDNVSENSDCESFPGVAHLSREVREIRDGEGSEGDHWFLMRGREIEGQTIDPEDGLTISMWVQQQDSNRNGRLVTYGAAGDSDGYRMEINEGVVTDGTTGFTAGPFSLPEGEWKLVTMVIDRASSEFRVLLDDRVAGQAVDISELGPIPRRETDFTLGGAGGCCFPHLLMDEAWSEQRAWSDTRVGLRYENQRPDGAPTELGALEALR